MFGYSKTRSRLRTFGRFRPNSSITKLGARCSRTASKRSYWLRGSSARKSGSWHPERNAIAPKDRARATAGRGVEWRKSRIIQKQCTAPRERRHTARERGAFLGFPIGRTGNSLLYGESRGKVLTSLHFRTPKNRLSAAFYGVRAGYFTPNEKRKRSHCLKAISPRRPIFRIRPSSLHFGPAIAVRPRMQRCTPQWPD